MLLPLLIVALNLFQTIIDRQIILVHSSTFFIFSTLSFFLSFLFFVLFSSLFSTSFKIGFEPVTGFLQGLLEGSELEVGVQAHELAVVGGLLVLPVCLCAVEHQVALEAQALDQCLRHGPDGHLVLLGHRQDEGLRLVVVVKHPQEEAPEVLGEHELAQRRARAPHRELLLARLHRQVAAVHHARQHVAVRQREVVLRPEDVRRDHRHEPGRLGELVCVASVHHIDHPLCICVPFVTRMWWTNFC